MELKKILQGIEGIKAKGELEIDVKNITNDSRKVEEKSMFIAIKGFETDGHKFVKDVIEKRPSAIMVQEGADLRELAKVENITILVVPDTRKALAVCSSNFYGNPSQKLKLIGVTGTKGKTTTTYMIKEMLEKQGKKVRTDRNNSSIYKWKKTRRLSKNNTRKYRTTSNICKNGRRKGRICYNGSVITKPKT